MNVKDHVAGGESYRGFWVGNTVGQKLFEFGVGVLRCCGLLGG
jgi:hypothetical protein